MWVTLMKRPTNEELDLVCKSLVPFREEMFIADKERNWAKCKYMYVADPANKFKGKKILIQTDRYRRVFFDELYLGIAPIGDNRFGEDGQYIVGD